MPGLSVAALSVEGQDRPLGLDEPRPRLGWQLRSDRRNVRQVAYQVRVLSSSDDDSDVLWTSGRVESDESWLVDMDGLILEPCRRYHWQVEVWDDTGSSATSEQTWWETGLLDRSPAGAWISAQRPHDRHEDHRPAPHVRKRLTVEPGLVSARAYVTAAGLYELHCNGARVGADLLRPGWTEYAHRVFYQCLDLTEHLRDGDNVVGLVLGDGWWSGHVGFGLNREMHVREPAGRAEIRLTYADGRVDVITTDETWQGAVGPILVSDLLMGEVYDARRELGAWTDPQAPDDPRWKPAREVAVDAGPIVGQQGPSVRVTDLLPGLAVTEPQPGSQVVDFGQNLVGWVRLTLDVPAGQIVRIRHAEMLNPDGTIYTENLRSARATDTYIGAGKGRVTWEPTFTVHGFRYAEITGLPAPFDLADASAVVVHSDCPPTGEFRCSSDIVNQLQSNIVWGQRGNFVEVPTDCPQRDERLGWMGDAQVFARTACFNFDVRAMLGRWLVDVALAQTPDGAFTDVVPASGLGGSTPAWGDAGVIVPFELYRAYGDRRVLERALPSMRAWVDHIARHNPDNLWREARGSDYADWLAIDSETSPELIGTAFFAHSSRLVSWACAELGDEAGSASYAALADDVAKAFTAAYVDTSGAMSSDTQTAYVLALRFDLLTPDLRDEAARRLAADVARRGCLTTGFVGVRHLLPALSMTGRDDLAYRLLEHDGFPSWLYSVRRGATTIWERWDGWTDESGFQTPGMNSFNHYAYGAVGEWMYEVIGGLSTDVRRPGYRHAQIRPRPGGSISSAAASLQTPYGQLACRWEKVGEGLHCAVEIPPNTTAAVTLPAGKGQQVLEGEVALEGVVDVHDVSRDDNTVTFSLGSGSYAFTVR